MSAMTGINDDYKILSLCRQAETGEDQPQATQQEYYFKSIGFHINQVANVAIFSENSAFVFKFCVFIRNLPQNPKNRRVFGLNSFILYPKISIERWICLSYEELDVTFSYACRGYRLFCFLPTSLFLEPTKPFMNGLISFLTPSLIFAQLLLTFCKIEPKELVPRVWHGWLLAIQAISCGIIALLLIFCPMDESYKEIFEAAMVCLICPTATAAAVITGKLGGSASSLTTYTLLSNILAAIAVPLVFPLVEPHTDVTFGIAFLKILSKVFPLLLAPFFIALLFRYYIPRFHKFLLEYHTSAFYLWAIALTIVMGQTTRSLVNSTADVTVEMLIAFAGLVTCCLQFYFGKRIGSAYNDRISAGQALGQKNTVLAIWMAVTYLNPLSSVGPGSYVVWQNIINSYQLWKKEKMR